MREGYLAHLLGLGQITREEADQIAEARRQHLEEELSLARSDEFKPHYSAGEGIWHPYRGGADARIGEVETGVDRDSARALLAKLAAVPDGFKVHPKIARSLAARLRDGQRPAPARLGQRRGAGVRHAWSPRAPGCG